MSLEQLVTLDPRRDSHEKLVKLIFIAEMANIISNKYLDDASLIGGTFIAPVLNSLLTGEFKDLDL